MQRLLEGLKAVPLVLSPVLMTVGCGSEAMTGSQGDYAEATNQEDARNAGGPKAGSPGDAAPKTDGAPPPKPGPQNEDDFTLGEGSGAEEWRMPDQFDSAEYDGNRTVLSGSSVRTAVSTSCTTSSVRGLSKQLVEQVNCMRPGTMSSIAGISGVSLGGAVTPYLQKPATRSLKYAENERSSILQINSAFRTVAQQYLLYRWYRQGRCNIGLAADPGSSNHESGLAVDVQNYRSFRTALERHGFSWYGPGDRVHYNYVAGGIDLRPLSVKAFQKLWNTNNPNDTIAVDGVWGPATRSRLKRTPATGFAGGASCNGGTDNSTNGSQQQNLAAIEVYWHRKSNGTYKLRALAPSKVKRVTYHVDGYKIGESTRSKGSNFPDSYTFHKSKRKRQFEVRGYNGSGDQIAQGVGLLDVRSGWGAYVKQMGDHQYEFGLERAPSGVAAIEVRVDGYLLKDGNTQMTRSPRNAVRSYINNLGERDIKITTYNADGTVRGNIHRTFTLE